MLRCEETLEEKARVAEMGALTYFPRQHARSNNCCGLSGVHHSSLTYALEK